MIKESWEDNPTPSKNEIQYIFDVRVKLHILGHLPWDHLLKAQAAAI